MSESVESMLLALDSQGTTSRLIHLRPGDLRFLEVPALLRFEDGTWLTLRGRRGDDLLVEVPNGLQRFSCAELEKMGPSVALQILEELPEGASLRRIVAALLASRRRVAIQAAIGGAVVMLLALIPPQLTRVIVDRALPGGDQSLVALLAAGIVVVALFQAWAGWLRGWAILYVKARIETTLGQGFLSHLLRLPFSFLNGRSGGQLLQGFIGLGNVQDVLTERAVAAAFDGMMAVFYLAVLLSMMPGPTGAVALAALAMVVLTLAVARRQAALQRKETEAQNEQRDFLVEMLSGVATLKATGSEKQALGGWLRRLRREHDFVLRRLRVGNWSETGMEVVRQFLIVVLLVWGAGLVLEGATTTGRLLAFLQMSSVFLASVMGAAGIYSVVALLRPQLATVTEALQCEPRPRHPRRPSSRLDGPIVLEKVWFRYDADRPWVVRELDLEVSAGEKRWIHGPSGSGKSTILRLISGLYPPERGTIRIGGRNPAEANDLIVYLPQFVRLYGGSILENLEILSRHAKRERLLEAAEASGLHSIVSRFPMGYETPLPPGGATLSGGERQLVALTAVMASDRSVFLLDEALANIDWVSRSWIEHSSWFDGKTMIYASHDTAFGAGSVVSSVHGS